MRLDTVENAEMKRSLTNYHKKHGSKPNNPVQEAEIQQQQQQQQHPKQPDVPPLDLQNMNSRMWLKVTDKKGRDYWYHKDTKETTWTNPSTLGQLEVEKYKSMNTDEVASDSEMEATARTETQRRQEREKQRAKKKAGEDEAIRVNLKEVRPS